MEYCMDSCVGAVSKAFWEVPPLLMDVQPENHILDMCAAPDSKTFHILEMIQLSAETGATGLLPGALEAACRLVKSAGDDVILDQILFDGVKARRKCKGKNSSINEGMMGGLCPKASACEVGMAQDSGAQFRDVINAYLGPKCHSPDSETVQRACSQHPFLRSQLQQIFQKYFKWSAEKTDEYILPKIAERELRKFENLHSTSSALEMKSLLSEVLA